jgi:hypothetical protein
VNPFGCWGPYLDDVEFPVTWPDGTEHTEKVAVDLRQTDDGERLAEVRAGDGAGTGLRLNSAPRATAITHILAPVNFGVPCTDAPPRRDMAQHPQGRDA